MAAYYAAARGWRSLVWSRVRGTRTQTLSLIRNGPQMATVTQRLAVSAYWWRPIRLQSFPVWRSGSAP